MFLRLPPPRPSQLLSAPPPVTENGEEEDRQEAGQEAGGVASINYIVLDLDPTSASEAGPITPGTKAGDPVPVTSGHFYASIK